MCGLKLKIVGTGQSGFLIVFQRRTVEVTGPRRSRRQPYGRGFLGLVVYSKNLAMGIDCVPNIMTGGVCGVEPCMAIIFLL